MSDAITTAQVDAALEKSAQEWAGLWAEFDEISERIEAYESPIPRLRAQRKEIDARCQEILEKYPLL